MDELDEQILEELNEDARKPFSQISKVIGVSTQTVINRYNEMKSSGIIKICSITIDLEKVGYEGTAHLLLKISPSSDPKRIVNQMKNKKDVIIASTALGDYECYIVIAFRNTKDLFTKILELKELKGIERIEFFISILGMKNFPPIPHYNEK